MALTLAVVHEGISGWFGDGAAVGLVVLVAEGGRDEGVAEWLRLLLLVMMMLLLLLDGLEVGRRLDCVEIGSVDIRCEVGRQNWVKGVCWRT